MPSCLVLLGRVGEVVGWGRKLGGEGSGGGGADRDPTLIISFSLSLHFAIVSSSSSSSSPSASTRGFGWIVSQEIRKNGKVTNKQQETGEIIKVQTNTCLAIFCNLCTVKYRSSPSSSCKTWRRVRDCWTSIPGSSTRSTRTSWGDARRDPGPTEAPRLLEGRHSVSPDVSDALRHQHRNPGRATG